jgi:light-regulated signal transduction histidine kinase (bacteriophytochrome)
MPSPRDPLHPLALRAEPVAPSAGPGLGAADEMNQARAKRLASAEQTLRDIAHALAHDVRTSLRHVASYAELLEDHAGTGEPEHTVRLARKVVDSSRQLQRLMASVAALARLQVADLRLEPIATGELVRSICQELGGQARDGVRVACDIAPDLPPMLADRALIRQVWQELLGNAWRHAGTHAAPLIEVRYEAVPGGQAFFVHDNGSGFDPNRTSELFGLFQRAHGVPETGLGAGLAMVRRIIECHGGRVWATARPGDGASFGFSLPGREA